MLALPFETLAALVVFAFVTSITPGPSNLMLLASGANFGFLRTVPQVLGITVGFTSMLVAVGLGFGALLTAHPALHLGLKLAGGAYLLLLAWRIGTSRKIGDGRSEARPLTFFESAAFQWVNPKAWVVAGTTMAVYTSPEAPFVSVAAICAAFALVNLPTVSVWVGCGMGLRRFLADPVRLGRFNVAMGIALAATLVPMMR